jgi:hypothetical protein
MELQAHAIDRAHHAAIPAEPTAADREMDDKVLHLDQG